MAKQQAWSVTRSCRLEAERAKAEEKRQKAAEREAERLRKEAAKLAAKAEKEEARRQKAAEREKQKLVMKEAKAKERVRLCSLPLVACALTLPLPLQRIVGPACVRVRATWLQRLQKPKLCPAVCMGQPVLATVQVKCPA